VIARRASLAVVGEALEIGEALGPADAARRRAAPVRGRRVRSRDQRF
jgi:hypothetical protein